MNTDQPLKGVHYICVDVETSALRPADGELLTVGAVAVDAKGNVVGDFYVRVDAKLPQHWYDESLSPRSDTETWWRDQSDYVKDEAYRDRTLKRVPKQRASHLFRNWVLDYGEEWTDRIFVASPDKFDWTWIDNLFSAAGVMDPFWYHGIDLWSLNMGAYAQKRTGAKKGLIDLKHRFTSHEPVCPHHALSDAFAAAQDLAEFLENDIIELDAPHLDGFQPPVVEVKEEVVDTVEDSPSEEE